MSWDNTPIIDSVQLPGRNTKYFVADAEARDKIDALVSATHFIGVSSTEITDGGNESPTIGGATVTPAAGDIVIYKPLTGAALEFIWDPSGNQAHPNGCWQLLGGESVDNLGDLAFKDSASGSYTPEGSISINTDSVSVINSVTVSNFQVTMSLSDSYVEGYDMLDLAFAEFSYGNSGEGIDVVTSINSITTSDMTARVKVINSAPASVVTGASLSFYTRSVVGDFESEDRPSIQNTSTLTVAMGSGSSSSTLIFSLSDIGFNPGHASTPIYSEVYATSDYTPIIFTYDSIITNDVDIVTSTSISANIDTSNINIPVALQGAIYYKASGNLSLAADYSSVVSEISSATFSGSAATITVS